MNAPAAPTAVLNLPRTQLIERMLKRDLNTSSLRGIESVPREAARVALSPAQARIWFFTCLFPSSSEYNVFETLRLAKAPDEARLASALRTLMVRHDALRLRILTVDGGPLQEICNDLDPPVQWHDLSALDPTEAERRAEEIGGASARRALAPDEPPLFRVTAIRLPQGPAVLVFVMHHLIVDYWSTALLLEELSALLAERQPKPACSIGFLDYIAWERSTTDERQIERELDYWRYKLAGALPVLDLPADRPRPLVPTRGGRAIPLTFSADVVCRIKRFAKRERTTVFITLLAAYKALLLQLTRQTDLIVGTTLAGRDHPIAESLVGCFVKTVALRSSLHKDISFVEAVRRVHTTVVEAQEHQTAPYERVVASLKIPRERNYNPVFQTYFGLQSANSLHLADGAEVGSLLLESDSAKWDLTVSLTETAAGISGFIEYSSDLFDERTVAGYGAMYARLVEAVLEEPALALKAHSLISRQQRDHILNGLNPYVCPQYRYKTMAEPFEEQVKRSPQAIALVGEEGSLTYAALNERANRLAHFLRAAGAARGVRIGICMERAFGTVIALYAIAKSGAAYVPLDPELPHARLSFMLEDTEPRLVLVDRRCRERIPTGPWQIVCVEDGEQWSAMPTFDPICEGPPQHLLHLLYTSGSTGRPKAVAYPVDGAIANIFWLQRSYPFASGDTALFKTSYGFDVSIWEIFWPLYCGARLAVCASGAHRDPRQLADLIERYRVTTIFIIPTLMQVFLEQIPAGSCSSLRWVFCGGEPVTPHIRDRFYAQFAARLINCYGPTEAGCVTDMVLEPAPRTPIVPLGRPAENFRLYVLDDELEVTPIGVPGEVYLAGAAGLAHGYFRRPALTADRFIPDPYAGGGARMYRTGDICRYRHDGTLEHLGRCGRQIKVRGMRIELAEIESVLREHATVKDCVVFATDDAAQRLLAFVVPAASSVISPQELKEYAGRLLPRYMVPVSIVSVDRIPATVNGKTDREALLQAWRAAASESPEIVAPASVAEERLAAIFARVLEVPQVSVTDSFFELGGHSLLIFKLIAACPQELGIRPSVVDVFSAPSVRELANRLGATGGNPEASLVPISIKPGKPIIAFVHAASGSVLPFLEVARRLDEFSIYGLQASADELGVTSPSIEDLAACYVEALDAVRGMSPLILAGWSMGGCVALEMARLWRTRSIDVAAILMLDTWIPPALLASPASRVEARTAILAMDILGFENSGDDPSEPPGEIKQIYEALQRNRDAFLNYDPTWFDGDVDLLCTREPLQFPTAQLPDEYAQADKGWRARIRGVKVREIPGNHFTLVAAENADRLAATIRETVEARTVYIEM